MASELLLINPRRRRKGRKAKARRKVRATRRRHVARKVSRRRRRHAAVRVVSRRRRRNPRAVRRVHSRRRRSNPRFLSGLSLGGLKSALIPAFIGGAGAVALDVALSYIPLPPMLQTGYAKTGVKIAGALGLGFVAGKVVGKEKGRAVMLGALTVVAYTVVRDLVKQFAPTVPGLSGDYADNHVVGYGINPAPMLTGAYMDNSVGAYMDDGVGAYMADGM